MSRIIHFEVYADDPKRAVDFYNQVFDWEIAKRDGPMDYWTIQTDSQETPGLRGSILPRANQGTINITIQVPSVDEHLPLILDAGGEIVTPKTAIPGLGYMAYCTDTEGNVFGILEIDRSAR